MQTFSRRSFLYGTGAAFAALSAPGVLRAAAADVTHTPVEVSTPLGRLRGLEADGIRVFRGVPFGEDPYVAERRFLAPLKAKPWTGVLDATKPGAIPLQPDRKTPSNRRRQRPRPQPLGAQRGQERARHGVDPRRRIDALRQQRSAL